MAAQRLKEAAEKAKCELSTVLETTINLPYITATDTGPKHLQVTLTRSQFEQMTKHLTDRCRNPVMETMQSAKLSAKDIDEVVLVGGSTACPRFSGWSRRFSIRNPTGASTPMRS